MYSILCFVICNVVCILKSSCIRDQLYLVAIKLCNSHFFARIFENKVIRIFFLR